MPTFSAMDLAKWAGGQWTPRPPQRIGGVCHDTRTLQPGDLYLALTGERHDGHAFVSDAFARGACGAVVQANAPLPLAASDRDRPLLRVDDPAEAMRRMAAAYRRAVAPTVIAVTGTAGKSTVKEATGQVLERHAPTSRTRGNWNNDIGLPLSLLAMEPDTRYGVFELGMNHPGEIGGLCRILQPDWTILTNIGPGHIEFFPDERAIANEKADALRALPSSGRAFLWKETQFADLLREACRCPVTWVSAAGAADYTCLAWQRADGTFAVGEAASGERADFRWRLPGRHDLLNALFAIAVGRAAGMGWDAIRLGLENFQPMPMRSETLVVGGLRIVNDAYNANPLSMRAALDAFAALPVPGSKWLVLGDMLELGDRTEAEHRRLGEVVVNGPWAGVLLLGEQAQRVADAALAAGWPASRMVLCADKDAAAAALKAGARAGDAVLLKGSRRMKLEEIVERLK
jgi:UDP-N-acetylmuramoyl-tripeptide--D-alanyl-D-alanine ligase